MYLSQNQLKDLSPEKQELILRKLREKKLVPEENAHSWIEPVSAVADDVPIPLSFSQERLWFIDQLDHGNTAYNLPLALRLSGLLRVDALEKSLNEIFRRHEVLRTFFEVINGSPVQKVIPELNFKLAITDLSRLPENEREEKVLDILTKDTEKVFVLSKGPLIRIRLIMLAKDEHVLVLIIHHLVIDAWSQDVLVRELSAFYNAFANGAPFSLAPLPIQYGDYAHWQRRRMRGKVLEEQLSYWKKQMDPLPPSLEIPADRLRPSVQTYRGSLCAFDIDAATTRRLKHLGGKAGTTLFMTLFSVFAIFLYRITGQKDIAVATPVANRNRREFESLIGFFVNTLVMRVDLTGDPTFRELQARVHRTALDAYAHQDLPFEKLVEELPLERDMSRPALTPVLFSVNNVPRSSVQLPGLSVESLQFDWNSVRFDFEAHFMEFSNGVKGNFVYNTDLFDAATIERLVGHFKMLVEDTVRHHGRKLSRLSLFTDEERTRWLESLNKHQKPEYRIAGGVHQLFENRARQFPDAVAAVFENRRISYDELNKQANQLARLLREMGIGPDRIVGIMLDRSIDMLVCILAVLKAGGAYLPIDPDYPEDRIHAMLDGSGASILLTREELTAHLSFSALSNLKRGPVRPVVTPPRAPVKNFDRLPLPDRTLVNYDAYHRFIGIAPVKHTISLQTSRGCPFNCLYCHKIWPKKHVLRSADNIYEEIRHCRNAGVRRFVVLDDIFNLDRKNSSLLLQKIIKNKLDINLFFPNGLRGDILTKKYIDLLVEAGTVDIAVALESASPRIQKMVRKNLDLERFSENVHYIAEKHPGLILEMHMMFGFPTETQQEALLTFDFLKEIQWVHFPNLFLLKIFPNTEMARFAVENGVSPELIEHSADRAYHELPETLPFADNFVREYQSRFMSEYFLSKERLSKVLPAQMKILTEDELVQKYGSYLPVEIKHLDDILAFAGLSRNDLGSAALLPDDHMCAAGFSRNIRKVHPVKAHRPDAFRILLLDLSLLFSSQTGGMLYDVVEAPLGLMYLLTYINAKLGEKIHGKIGKSRIDFDNFEELKHLIDDQRPQVIGIRTLSLFKDFFHTTVNLVRQWLPDVPIITGGPYATSDYATILADRNVDVVVLGEGELTFHEVIVKIMENNGRLPSGDVLADIPGLAFMPELQGTQESARSSLIGHQPEAADRTRQVLLLDHIKERIARINTDNLPAVNRPRDLAYVLYTSGSTGRPKATAMVHRALTNLILWHLDHDTLKKKARTLQFAPFTFDVSFQELFSTWSSGGTLILTSEETRRDAAAVWRLLIEKDVERLFLPFVALHQLAETALSSEDVPIHLREVITAGEQLKITSAIAGLFKKLKGCSLHNHYGPCETHVVTAFTLDGHVRDWPKLPCIGRPIANTRIYILDPEGEPVPIGVQGELHIGGDALGRGYIGRPRLTDEKFIPDPFSRETDAKLYKTGDLARYLPDGHIEYLGRMDNQVKIRGYRIEPGEIEAVLSDYQGIRETAVIAREYQPGDRRLIAYVAPHAGAPVTVAGLRDYMKRRLPSYMIPSLFVMLEKLPLTASGKVKRRDLPGPDSSASLSDGYTPPSTPVQEVLAAIWAKVLGVERVGIHDNFFELGGHSLLATQVISRMRDALSTEIPVRRIFESPTIKALADHIEAGERTPGIETAAIEPVGGNGDRPLSFAQERLWFLTRFEGENATYNMPAAVKLTGPLNLSALKHSFEEITRRHGSLRTIFPVKNNAPVQVIVPEMSAPFKMTDMQDLPANWRNTEMQKLAGKEAVRTFNLARGPLLRIRLFRMAEEAHVLLVNFHHIIFDGWSIGIFLHELSILYNAYVDHQAIAELPELTVQYADYACWQRNHLTGEVVARHLAYWKEQLNDAPTQVLPVDFASPETRTYGGGIVRFDIDPIAAKKLYSLGIKTGTSLFMTLLSAYYALLYRLSGQADIVVGVPIANRTRKEIEPLIGFFVDILPLRTNLSGNPTFKELLKTVRKVTLDAYAHQNLPFVNLVRALRPDRKQVRQPLYQVSFGLMNATGGGLNFVGLQAEQLELYAGMTQCDLFLSVTETKDGLKSFFEYDTDIFKPSTIEELADHFRLLLSAVAKDPGLRMLDVPFSETEGRKGRDQGLDRTLNDEADQFQF